MLGTTINLDICFLKTTVQFSLSTYILRHPKHISTLIPHTCYEIFIYKKPIFHGMDIKFLADVYYFTHYAKHWP